MKQAEVVRTRPLGYVRKYEIHSQMTNTPDMALTETEYSSRPQKRYAFIQPHNFQETISRGPSTIWYFLE